MSSDIVITTKDILCDLRNTRLRMVGYPWIRQWLKEERKSQAALARAINLDGPQMTRSLDGERDFTPKELIQVAKFLDKSIDEVLTGKSAEKLRDSEVALADMFKALFKLLEQDKPITKIDLLRQIIHLQDGYQKEDRKTALKVMEILGEYANADPHESGPQPTKQLAGRVPAGRA